MVGDIYLGRVDAVLPGIQAAFVDIGQEKSAFLHASDLLEPDEDEEPDEEEDEQPDQESAVALTAGDSADSAEAAEPVVERRKERRGNGSGKPEARQREVSSRRQLPTSPRSSRRVRPCRCR